MFNTFFNNIYSLGLSDTTVYALLFLPIAAAIVCISKYIMGLKSFSLSIILLLFYTIYSLGIQSQLNQSIFQSIILSAFLIIVILLLTLWLYTMLKSAIIHYLTKVAIVISITSFIVLGILLFLSQYSLINLQRVSIAPVLLIVILSDTIIRTYIRKNTMATTSLTIKSVVLAGILAYIYATPQIKLIILANPLISVIALFISALVGSWKGIRLSEYIRFKNLLIYPNDNEPESHTKKS